MAHGSGGSGRLDMYSIAEMTAAGHTVLDGLYMSAAAAHGDAFSHDGILGQEFFAHSTLLLDFAEKRVEVGDIARPAGARAHS